MKNNQTVKKKTRVNFAFKVWWVWFGLWLSLCAVFCTNSACMHCTHFVWGYAPAIKTNFISFKYMLVLCTKYDVNEILYYKNKVHNTMLYNVQYCTICTMYSYCTIQIFRVSYRNYCPDAMVIWLANCIFLED